MTKLPLGSIRVPDLLIPTLHRSLVAASNLDHGSRVPTTWGAGGCYLGVECGNRGLESREGSLEYYPSEGCFRLRQRYPRIDQSESPSHFLLIDRKPKCTQDTMINREDYVELGLTCADACTALDRGLNGKRLNDLGNSVREAVEQLTT